MSAPDVIECRLRLSRYWPASISDSTFPAAWLPETSLETICSPCDPRARPARSRRAALLRGCECPCNLDGRSPQHTNSANQIGICIGKNPRETVIPHEIQSL